MSKRVRRTVARHRRDCDLKLASCVPCCALGIEPARQRAKRHDCMQGGIARLTTEPVREIRSCSAPAGAPMQLLNAQMQSNKLPRAPSYIKLSQARRPHPPASHADAHVCRGQAKPTAGSYDGLQTDRSRVRTRTERAASRTHPRRARNRTTCFLNANRRRT